MAGEDAMTDDHEPACYLSGEMDSVQAECSCALIRQVERLMAENAALRAELDAMRDGYADEVVAAALKEQG